jgi:hypothetical protein
MLVRYAIPRASRQVGSTVVVLQLIKGSDTSSKTGLSSSMPLLTTAPRGVSLPSTIVNQVDALQESVQATIRPTMHCANAEN